MDRWSIKQAGYDHKMHNHFAPVHTVGNGFICCRGFMEEQHEGIAGLGGIYMAGVFGRASYTPWSGDGQELVNVPNFFSADIVINGEPVKIRPENLHDYTEILDIKNAVFTRKYIYALEGVLLASLEFTRFISRDDIHLAGQRVTAIPLREGVNICVNLGLDPDVTNLNELSSEPYPVQPGKRHLTVLSRDKDTLLVQCDGADNIKLAFAQHITVQGTVYEKLVYIPEPGRHGDMLAAAKEGIANAPSFQVAFDAHKAAMSGFWSSADVIIEGDDEAQLSLRYNLLQLEQSCPRHTDMVSIGARGLTGEMYEGSVFWDTEIFMLPFFTLHNPAAAKNLLRFRYNTLPKACEHARNNWFEGAMYGWQVNAQGVEQTPQGVGAYYSIHVIADIAFAIKEYWDATGDDEFILQYGLEILTETARFWASRATKREDGLYDIIAVRGPNEYAPIVNNNLYTNMMAGENLRICDEFCHKFNRLNSTEIEVWREIASRLVLPYDREHDLWLEDDGWLRRRPLDMQRAKPTAKRIIDTTIPYEALPFYQVTKQADVLHAMKNLPWNFTKEQMQSAFDYYKPRTAFDSSLAYSMFALMAARLGMPEEALELFDKCINLDIRNVQLNTISGLHLANLGGSWQAAVFGFGGVTILPNKLSIAPNLPKRWRRIAFKLKYRDSRLKIETTHGNVQVTMLEQGIGAIQLDICGESYTLAGVGDRAEVTV